MAAGLVCAAGMLAAAGPLASALYDLSGVAGAVAILWGVRRFAPRPRGGWLFLAVGVALLAVGDIVYTAADFSGTEVPFPSAADVPYLMAYPALAAGVAVFTRARRPSRWTIVDALVIAAGLGTVMWPVVLRPLVEAADTTRLEATVAAAYPIGSLILLAFVSRLLLVRGFSGPAARMLFCGFGLQLAADAVYAGQSVSGTYSSGGLLDLCWMLSYVLYGTSALHPSMRAIGRVRRTDRSPLPRARLLLLMSTVCVPAIAHAVLDTDSHELAALTSAALALIVMARLFRPVAALNEWALQDPLTGLVNRSLFSDRLDQAAEGLADQPTSLGLLVCDLDDFKLVNEGLGHEAGDELLVRVAGRLRAVVHGHRLVGRMGADEFAVVLTGAGRQDVEATAQGIVRALSEPVAVGGDRSVHPKVSIGATLTKDPTRDADGLLQEAYAALDEAKRGRRGGFEWFDENLRSRAARRLRRQEDLRRAIHEGSLYCVFQPEITLATGELFGFEALLRWRHPDEGMIPPVEFIPLAEELGLIDELFDHVLRRTLTVQADWFQRLGHHPAVAVNLAPQQLCDPELPQRVKAVMGEFEPPDGSLWLEVTETALEDPSEIVPVLEELQELGIRLAVDDYGTGWSSLLRLASFRWDAVKIDKSFVDRIGGDEDAGHMVQATIAMAHALGCLTVAEGVETADQARLLSDMACDVAQGYLYATPLGAPEALTFIRRCSAGRQVLPSPTTITTRVQG